MLVAKAGTLSTSPREITSYAAGRKRKRRSSSNRTSLADKELKALRAELDWILAGNNSLEVSVTKSILFLACESIELTDSPEYYFRSRTDYDIFKYNWENLKQQNKRREYRVDKEFIASAIAAAIKLIERGL